MQHPMLQLAIVLAGSFVIAVTALSLVRAKAWWIRVWDFPRLQLAVLGTAAFAAAWFVLPRVEWPSTFFFVALGLSLAYQAARVWRYTRLAPTEVPQSRAADAQRRLSLAICNVLQSNRDAERLIAVLRSVDPDVVLCAETDSWWQARLEQLRETHPHTVQCPLSNTYGMLLYSRLPLHDTSIDYLVQPDIPSIQARVQLRAGHLVWLNCVHPPPPAPGESNDSLERDAELLIVGKRVRNASMPVIVCGDLNDVAWSRTTKLFQKISRLLDPRKGRGFFSTFHARIPGLRVPLDHIFHSNSFRLIALKRLPYVGSDHFPVYAELTLEPSAVTSAPPMADQHDEQEAHQTIVQGKRAAPEHESSG
jgi:endonuclease/exonuclease/phosphatase (EEP) superfamily protein YafD